MIKVGDVVTHDMWDGKTAIVLSIHPFKHPRDFGKGEFYARLDKEMPIEDTFETDDCWMCAGLKVIENV